MALANSERGCRACGCPVGVVASKAHEEARPGLWARLWGATSALRHAGDVLRCVQCGTYWTRMHDGRRYELLVRRPTPAAGSREGTRDGRIPQTDDDLIASLDDISR